MKEKRQFNILKFFLYIIVLAYISLLIADVARIIYYEFKLDNLEVKVTNNFEENRDLVKIDEEFHNSDLSISVDKNVGNEFAEYNYVYYVKLGTPPFNYIFKKGYKIKGNIVLNR